MARVMYSFSRVRVSSLEGQSLSNIRLKEARFKTLAETYLPEPVTCTTSTNQRRDETSSIGITKSSTPLL